MACTLPARRAWTPDDLDRLKARSRALAGARRWDLDTLAREFGATRSDVDGALWGMTGGAPAGPVATAAVTSGGGRAPSGMRGFLKTMFGGGHEG